MSGVLPSVPADGDGGRAMDRVLELMAQLRAPDGCPWDREQTPASLKPQLLEECYEVLEAIDSGSSADMVEELGDLLLHIAFQAQIARERGDFTFADVATALGDKLVRRHPHVFGAEKVADSAATIRLWDELKKAEKPERTSALDGVPRHLPALMRAHEVQKKAARVGFDWPDAAGPREKIAEELRELAAEIEAGAAPERMADEAGDLLFAVVNYLRHLKVDSETALSGATVKFDRRFRAVEAAVAASGKPFADHTLDELEILWQAVKKKPAA